MSGSATALILARATGRPVPIPGGNGLVAYPTGTIGTPVQPVAPSAPFSAAGVQGLPGSPSGPAVAPPTPPATPPSWWQLDEYGRPIPTINVSPQPQQPAQPPLNQANPNFTAGIQGLPGSPSGPAVAPPGGFPPPHVPDLVVTAHRYRAAHGLSTSDDTDALNAESLAAAQAGRNYFNPQLAAQYGQPQAAGVYGPRTDVVNALSLPPSNG